MADDIGLTDKGFKKRYFSDIIKDMKAKLSEIWPDASTDNSSPDVQQMGITADHYTQLWDLLLTIFTQLDPNTAEGSYQDILNEGVRGVPRIIASPTEVTCELTGTPATVIPAGSLVSCSDPLLAYISFSTKTDVTLDGSGDGLVVVVADINGAIAIASGKIDTIDTPISGWSTVGNTAAGVAGTADETTLEYRARADRSTALRGKSMPESLEAALLALQGVTMVVIHENRTTSTDADGVPAKSVECFVLGGVAQEISQTIFDIGGFIGYYGTTTGTAFDYRGRSYEVKWSRPVAVPVDVRVDVKEMTGWSISRVTDIKNACLAFYDGSLVQEGVESGYIVDQDPYAADLYAPVGIINALRVNSIGIRKTSVGGSYLTTLAMGYDEYPTLVVGSITVVHAP
jgi:uncharacterized phage protein gp47/JayE